MTEAFIAKYGNPDKDEDGILDLAWAEENLKVFDFPFPMVLSWSSATVSRFQAHRLAGPKIQAALRNMAAYKGLEYIKGNRYDRWGGCFNFRLIRGGTTLSAHSWGTAVDINPAIGRLGSRSDASVYPRFIIEAFRVEGFAWGGVWARPDAMHFELRS